MFFLPWAPLTKRVQCDSPSTWLLRQFLYSSPTMQNGSEGIEMRLFLKKHVFFCMGSDYEARCKWGEGDVNCATCLEQKGFYMRWVDLYTKIINILIIIYKPFSPSTLFHDQPLHNTPTTFEEVANRLN